MEATAEGLYAWLKDAAWPLWLARGVDWEHGAFHEALDLRTQRCAAPFRRLRVAARQIFVFSQAHEAGLTGAADAIRLGLDFLARHAAHPEGGYAWRFDLSHRPLDARRDLYDHAFVLLALSTAAGPGGMAGLREPAVRLAMWLKGEFSHPAGGYVESLPPALPRRQNPHMHLLEALLAAHAAFGCPPFLDMAQGILDLFAARFLDRESGVLAEYYDDTLLPLREDGVFSAEPGHHCEWAWLLHEAALLGLDVPPASEALWSFVDRHGFGKHGGLVDELGSNGQVVSATSRLWPQTENLRAEFLRRAPDAARRGAAVANLCAYLRPDGLWHERRLADGSFSDEAAPASSLYHLTGAILSVRQSLLF